MTQLIKHGTLPVDTWKTLEIAEGETPDTVTLVLKPNGNFQGFQAGLEGLSISAHGIHAGLKLFAFLLKSFEVGRRSDHGQTLREQEIAAITSFHFNHIAKNAEIFNVGAKYQFHVRLLKWCSFS